MRKIKAIFMMLLFCSAVSVSAYSYDIIGEISGITDGDEVVLVLQQGDSYKEIARTLIENNKVHFTLDDASPKGVYQVRNGIFKVEVLFDHQDTVFNTTYLTPIKNIRFIEGSQNQAFYDLRNAIENYAARNVFLTRLLNVYSIHDPFYQSIQNELSVIQENSIEKIRAALLKDKTYPLLAKKLRYEEQLAQGLRLLDVSRKQQEDSGKMEELDVVQLLFGSMDKNDLFLVNSNILNLALNNYLRYYYFLHKDDKLQQQKDLQQAVGKVQKYFKDSVLFGPLNEDIKRIIKKNRIALE